MVIFRTKSIVCHVIPVTFLIKPYFNKYLSYFITVRINLHSTVAYETTQSTRLCNLLPILPNILLLSICTFIGYLLILLSLFEVNLKSFWDDIKSSAFTQPK